MSLKEMKVKNVLDYLKSITTEAVAGPNIESNRLFHLEGMRFSIWNYNHTHKQRRK